MFAEKFMRIELVPSFYGYFLLFPANEPLYPVVVSACVSVDCILLKEADV